MPVFAEQVDIDAIITRAECLCRAVAPLDLADEPLYIVPQSRLPDHLGGKAVCDGFTSPRLDLYLQEVIGPAWRGRGPCMVVNDDIGDPNDSELEIFHVVLHELAHILLRPTPHRHQPSDEPGRLLFEALCVGNAVSREDEPAETAAPFQGHGLRFIRTALHLRHRAEVLGTLVPMFGYCAGNYYGLSHPNRYREALGDEPARLADMSFHDMLATPYPKAFWRLWSTDVARWLSDVSPTPERSLSP